MHVLAIIGQKGGNGKITVTLRIAVEAFSAGRSVAVIDLDPHGTKSCGQRPSPQRQQPRGNAQRQIEVKTANSLKAAGHRAPCTLPV
jgi:cellulose biosynthesis protein BcsQ